MKKIIVAIAVAGLMGGTAMADLLASWTFTGSTPIVSQVANSFDSDLATGGSYLDLTRGAGAGTSAGASSFRTTGFQNNGISTANTDYFQVILSADVGFSLSLSGINAYFNGTTTYPVSPGASMQWAYSLDGSTFTLIDSPVAKIGVATTSTTDFDFTGVSALQNVAAGTDVTLRMYATGQTSTGGWGFFSPGGAGNEVAGLLINGSTQIIPEPSVFALLAIGGLAVTRYARRRKV